MFFKMATFSLKKPKTWLTTTPSPLTFEVYPTPTLGGTHIKLSGNEANEFNLNPWVTSAVPSKNALSAKK